MRTSRAAIRCLLVLSAMLAAACDKPEATSTPDAGAPAPPAASVTSMVDAGAAPAKPTGKTVDTPAGLASEVGSEIHLAGKTLYPPEECAAGGKDGCAKVKAVRASMDGVKLLRHFDGPGGPKSILLLEATSSKGDCNGGPLFFVRVAKDTPPQYSDVFDYCGGPDPMVGAMPDKILINIPAHASAKGGAPVPAKQMEYDIATGKLQASAPAAKKKR